MSNRPLHGHIVIRAFSPGVSGIADSVFESLGIYGVGAFVYILTSRRMRKGVFAAPLVVKPAR